MWLLIAMFWNSPTTEELQQSDLPDLIDMLAKQTREYSQLRKSEGVTSRSIAIKEMIDRIQATISKKNSKKSEVPS